MNINDVIKYPILTEKTYKQMSEGVYTFAVDRRSNKVQVRKTVEFIFGVKVVKVNIFNVPKKEAKLGRSRGFTNAYKRAIVYLSEEDTINIFPDDAPATEPKKETKAETKAKVEKPKMSDAEKRAAEKIAQKAKAANAKKEVKSADTKTPAKTSTPKKATKATTAKTTSKASIPKKTTKVTSAKSAPKKVAPKKATTKKTVNESKGD